jgi:protease-4
MRKFLLGILCGLILAVLTVAVLAFSAIRVADRGPSIASSSVLMLNLEGEVAEAAPAEVPFPFPGGSSAITTHEVWLALRQAATDPRITAIGLTPRAVGAGWGKLSEIRSGLIEFRKSGKPVIAWLRNPGAREYYLATAADKIYLVEEDLLNVKGLRAELAFYKSTLDKIGVQVEVEHAGRYKDAGDIFSRTSSTPETREVVGSILDGVHNTIIQAIADGRKKTPEQVRALIDEGPWLATKAAKAGLVDGLLYEDQFLDELKKVSRQETLVKTPLRAYVKEAAAGQRGAKIAWIVGEGNILRGSSDGFDDGGMMLSENFNKLLRAVANDPSIRAAIVRVDSPGGDAIASDDMLREMKLLRQKKPVVISMSDVAASGGYYVAATGDPIVAYPNTITGSIGVVYGKPNLKGLYDKAGINKELITRGRNAAIDTDYGPMTPEARAKLREGIQATYDTFLQRVATARGTTPDKIEPVAQGRAWLGSDAHAQKLVDQLGGIDRAIALVREKAKIGASEPIQLVAYPPRRSVWTKWLSRAPEAALDAKLQAWLRLTGITSLPAPPPTGILRLMPYGIEIR